jgi:hypothetical protein
MIPAGGGGLGVPAPGGLDPHLVVRLETGWRYDVADSRFIAAEGEKVFAPVDLPDGSRIVYMIPDLQHLDRESMAADELELARYLHILLPPETDSAQILSRVAEWPCVAEARRPPEISLPDPESGAGGQRESVE